MSIGSVASPSVASRSGNHSSGAGGSPLVAAARNPPRGSVRPHAPQPPGNHSGGPGTVAPATITMGSIQGTLMACEGAASQAESDMGAVLAGTVTYEIDGAGLHLTNGTRGLDFVAT